MTEWIWLNGEIIPMSQARIDVEDRGFQFADGVYEVLRLYHGRPFAMAEHMQRLERSAQGILLPLPMTAAALAEEINKLIARSQYKNGYVYLQLTRGPEHRSHAMPAAPKPTLLFYARPLGPPPLPGDGEGVKLLSVPDERWKRCWIKSIALLPNILAKHEALSGGFDEAVFIDMDAVTECASSNIFAVCGNKLLTHPVGSKVLPGITRQLLLELAPSIGLEPDERRYSQDEAQRADELFITSTTREISWVARWNDRYIGQARCGPITKRLHQVLQDRIRMEIKS